MKNKEIELILMKLKIVSEEKENGAYICDKEHSKLLLSYIEQLKNNRDKAIEIINIEKSEMGYAKYDSCLLLIEEALKGDSDE